MNEKELFNNGCFLPCWAEDVDEKAIPATEAYTGQKKDLETLLGELAEIKEHLQEIQARQWHLARLIHFHENGFANS